MMKNLIIINAGNFGREVHAWIRYGCSYHPNYIIKGFLDNRPDILKGYNYKETILGSVETYTPEEDDVFICAIGDPKIKKELCENILAKNGKFTNIICNDTYYGNNVNSGQGLIVCPHCTISSDVKIGNFVSINISSSIGHDVSIGDYCQINSHVNITGNVSIGEGSVINSNACIVPGVTIGKNCFVGAGSVVLKNIGDGEKVFGNPARRYE